jgi:hypothetical protein
MTLEITTIIQGMWKINEYGVLLEWLWLRKNLSTHRKPCHSATLSEMPHGLGSNVCPCDNRLATNHLQPWREREREREREEVTVIKVVWLSPMWVLHYWKHVYQMKFLIHRPWKWKVQCLNLAQEVAFAWVIPNASGRYLVHQFLYQLLKKRFNVEVIV